MSTPQDPNFGAHQSNQQSNKASHGGQVFANQGTGTQQFNNTYHTNINAKYQTWTGWAILVMCVADVLFFIYGASAYTGRSGDTGDMWRAVTFLVLMTATASLVRRWFRRRL